MKRGRSSGGAARHAQQASTRFATRGRPSSSQVVPPGTLTFLFTDVEGSTRLWSSFPRHMRATLARHDELVESLVNEYRGQVVRPRGEGDSRFAVFARASDAVAAACAIQCAVVAEKWLIPEPLRLHMALHTGEAEWRDGDYYGSDVNRCARLRALAHGGQTLLSGVTADLVRDALPEQSALRELGVHRLKDLPTPERVYQLLHPSLPMEFPPLLSPGLPKHNLPAPTSSFIGRQEAVLALRRAIASSRLVTVTGPGGVGKTRLALAVGESLLAEYADGVWLVELASVASAALIAQQVVGSMGIREEYGRRLVDTLIEALRSRTLLLIIDTCEHLIAPCAELALQLLKECPGLKVLATSREPLAIAGETICRLAGLSSTESTPTSSTGSQSLPEAVELFVRRARAVAPGFALTDQNRTAVADVCRRLEGLPLALEIAAARMNALAPEQLASRLADQLNVLGRVTRDAPDRHRTLRATLEWSYALLSEVERLLFERVAVFSGSWSLEAAQVVGACDRIGPGDVLDILSRLIDKSLVVAESHSSGTARYHCLDTIRQFGLERLAARGDVVNTRDTHARFYTAFTESGVTMIFGRKRAEWMAQLDLECDNVRSALRWLIDSHDADRARRLASAFWPFWQSRAYLQEGNAWLEEILALPGDELAPVRINLLLGLAELGPSGSKSHVEPAQAALSLAKQLGDEIGVAYSLEHLGFGATTRGEYSTAQAFHEAALHCSIAPNAVTVEEHHSVYPREFGPYVRTLNLLHLGYAVTFQKEYATARQILQQARADAARLGYRGSVAVALNALGIIDASEGEWTAARANFEKALEIHLAQGDHWLASRSLINVARLDIGEGRLAHARQLLHEAFEIARRAGDRRRIAECLYTFAQLSARCGQVQRAMRLVGAAEALYEAIGARHSLPERWFKPSLATLEAEGAAEIAAGRGLSQAEAVREALTIVIPADDS